MLLQKSLTPILFYQLVRPTSRELATISPSLLTLRLSVSLLRPLRFFPETTVSRQRSSTLEQSDLLIDKQLLNQLRRQTELSALKKAGLNMASVLR